MESKALLVAVLVLGAACTTPAPLPRPTAATPVPPLPSPSPPPTATTPASLPSPPSALPASTPSPPPPGGPPVPLPFPTAPPLPASATLVALPAWARPGSNVTVRFRVAGGAAGEIRQAALGWGPSPGRAPPDYPHTVPAQPAPGGTSAGMEFSVNFIAPSVPGALYLRARAVVGGLDIFSEERELWVSPGYTRPAAEVLDAPAAARRGGLVEVRWRVSGGLNGSISHTGIHWGTASGQQSGDYPGEATPVGAPQPPATGLAPAEFRAIWRAPVAGPDLRLRAHALVDGEEVLSDERVVPLGTGGY